MTDMEILKTLEHLIDDLPQHPKLNGASLVCPHGEEPYLCVETADGEVFFLSLLHAEEAPK